jgi:hypothetical protein
MPISEVIMETQHMKAELFVMILEKLILFSQHVARAVAIRVLETNARFF